MKKQIRFILLMLVVVLMGYQPVEAGRRVTVTVGKSPPQTTTTTNDGHYEVTFLNPLSPIANSGDSIEVNVSEGAGIRTFVLTAQEIDAQGVTLDVKLSPSQPIEPAFDLSVPVGISLIHVPLKVISVDDKAMSIKTVGDLYDALGGANRVNFIITRDAGAKTWRSFLGNPSRGTLADPTLTDDMGVIAVMKSPVTLRLKGEALGTNGTSRMTLQPGTNLVGVPLMNQNLKRVSDLLSLEGIKSNATAIIVSDNGKFKVLARPGDDGDIPLTGGQSFLITARANSVANITGVAWDNASALPSAAPPMLAIGHQIHGKTPILEVHGTVREEGSGALREGFRVTVKNLLTGMTLSTLSGGDNSPGSYSTTFVDVTSSHLAQAGDILEITAETPSPFLGVQPLRYIVSTDDVEVGQIRLPDLIAYPIPKKTQLLPNYPNPFNPETWVPYRLAKDSFVTLSVYDTTGQLVRTIQVGHQPAAVYESKGKAIYWDGNNNSGERVAIGIYFYHLQVGEYHATRKMLILK